MKILFKTVLVLTICLASCQQEKVISPDQPEELASSDNLRENFTDDLPKNYQLIKHGGSTLSYSGDGRLRKVTYSPNVRGNFSVYAVYTYSGNSIVSKLYYDNKLTEVVTYLLDAKGRCYDSQQVEYIPYGPNTTLEKQTGFNYLYNPKGQLMTRTNKKVANEYTSFGYDAAGDLTKITNYGFSAAGPGVGIASESTLYYDQPAGDVILPDYSPVNCESANLPDPYLKIFGRPSNHLVKLITEKFSLGGKVMTYTLNADGYVKAKQTYDLFNGKLVETKLYDYLVTDITLNL